MDHSWYSLLLCSWNKLKHRAKTNDPGMNHAFTVCYTPGKRFLCLFQKRLNLCPLVMGSVLPLSLISFSLGEPFQITGWGLWKRTCQSIGEQAWNSRDNILHALLRAQRFGTGGNWQFSVFGKQPVSGALGTALLSSLFKFWARGSEKLVQGREINNHYSFTAGQPSGQP